MTPPNRSVRQADGTFLFSLDSAEGQQAVKSPPELLTIRTHDDARWDAMLVRPPGLDSKRRPPVIIEVNGEPRQQFVRNAWTIREPCGDRAWLNRVT
jgi:dipeptidyl aminopeptidase/acylaminoacyl peptidase